MASSIVKQPDIYFLPLFKALTPLLSTSALLKLYLFVLFPANWLVRISEDCLIRARPVKAAII